MRRRGRTAVASLLLAAGLLVTVDFVRGQNQPPPRPVAAPQSSPSTPAVQATPWQGVNPLGTVPLGMASPAPATGTPAPTAAAFPRTGLGTFVFATSTGPVLGTGGTVRQFRVAVENGAQQDVDAFAAEVDRILGDSRSWIASGDLRLQRVPQGGEFVIYLATEVTADQMCREDKLEINRYTSCRLASGKVVINLSRWLTAVPDYGAPLAVYRGYAINHEVGHQLGYNHERCPAPGGPAPVMQQQTLGLYGCIANPWPYVNGKRFTGPPGTYVPQ